MMILVTGATGHLGNAAIQSLLKKGVPAQEITALVRDGNKAAGLKDQGVQIKIGTYNDFDSLKAAFHGVDKLLLVSSNEMVDRLVQHKNAIDAAIENGVKHIVYTGIDIENYETTAIPYVSQIHKDTSDYLEEVGVPYTVLDNTLYADSIGLFSGETFLETGIFFPAGDGKTPWAARLEMGEAAAVVLTTPGHEGKHYAITAPTAYSFGDIAELLSNITGKEVKYHNPDLNTYTETLVTAGVPKEIASFLGGFGTAISNGEFDTHRSDLKDLLGRDPLELEEFLRITYGK